ncbi:MAG: NEW3 domain-containing protein, partial [Candidatus Methylomirabilales bacterium]
MLYFSIVTSAAPRRAPALGAVLGFLLALAPAPAAHALQLVTPYPAVSVEAGKSVTFNLEVRTPSPERVDLAVVEAPKGWQAILRGGGFIVHGLFPLPDKPAEAQLEVKVPPEAAKADYRVAVRASGGGAADTLVLSLRVAEVAAGAVTLTAEFPTLRQRSDASFTFNMTLTNNTPEATTFNLDAEGPPGWDVQVRPTAQAQATTVKVDGGGSTTIEVVADPPSNVPAGTFPITVRAAGGSKGAAATLTAEVTGSSRFTLTTPTGRLNAKGVAGRARDVPLIVRNEGSSPLQDIRLSDSPPTGWKVTFRPERVPEIAPNGSRRVVAMVTPSGDAVAGDYVLTISASGQGASDDIELR